MSTLNALVSLSRSALLFVVCLAAAVLVPASLARAQTPAAVSGIVVDQFGGAVAGAIVSAIQSDGAHRQTTETGTDGRFTLRGLPSGSYVLVVEKDLFQQTRRPVEVAAGGEQTVSITLRVAGLEESVSVVGAPKLDERPTGETASTIDKSIIQHTAGFSIAEVVGYSPGVTVNNSNGPRDVVVSVRGSGARASGTGLKNIQAFEDGFPITQPDGAGRTDAVDPHAYGSIDVFRGPSSALYGNFALEGSLNFHTRRPEDVNGLDVGYDTGSFGYRNSYLSYGHKADSFGVVVFGSVVRGDGFTAHTSYETYTLNALSTYTPSDKNRFTFKFISNDMYPNLSFRVSLNQFAVNPYQNGCGQLQSDGCASISVFANGATGAKVNLSAEQSGAQRHDRRTVAGARWEHFLSSATTFRTQLAFDLRDIKQPTAATAGLGTYPSFNFTSDLTSTGTLGGLKAVHFIGVSANFMNNNAVTFNVAPGGNATLGVLTASTYGHISNLGVRVREELHLTPTITATAGLGIERTGLQGINQAYAYSATAAPTTTLVNADRTVVNVAPEASLVVQASSAIRLQSHLGVGYESPGIGNLFVTPDGVSGNNTQLKSMRNIGLDVSADVTAGPVLTASVAGFYEWYLNELLTQSPGINLLSYTFNAPRSIHKGVEATADLHPLGLALPGLRWLTSYTLMRQTFAEYTERLSAGSFTAGFDRAGNSLPGVAPNTYQSRVAYDQPSGALAGLGAYVEVSHRDEMWLDNASLIAAPAYTIGTLGLHYDARLGSRARGLKLLFEVRNLTNKVYVASAFLLSDSLNSTTGAQNPTSVLANSGSLLAGAPRTYTVSARVTF